MKPLLDTMRKVIAFLLPREEHFFETYITMLGHIKESITLMKEARKHNLGEIEKQIIDLEQKCDDCEEEIKQKLRASITTPPQLNRESILVLANIIDGIMDNFKSIVRRLVAGETAIITLLEDRYDDYWKILDHLTIAADLCLEVMKDFSENKLKYEDPRILKIYDIENEIDSLHVDFIRKLALESDDIPAGKALLLNNIVNRVEAVGDSFQSLMKIVQGVLVNCG